MSLEAVNWSLRHEGMHTTPRHVLTVLAHHASKKNASTWVGVKKLGGETGHSRQTVGLALRYLEAVGLVEIERRGRHEVTGGRQSDLKTLKLDAKFNSKSALSYSNWYREHGHFGWTQGQAATPSSEGGKGRLSQTQGQAADDPRSSNLSQTERELEVELKGTTTSSKGERAEKRSPSSSLSESGSYAAAELKGTPGDTVPANASTASPYVPPVENKTACNNSHDRPACPECGHWFYIEDAKGCRSCGYGAEAVPA